MVKALYICIEIFKSSIAEFEFKKAEKIKISAISRQ